MPSFITHCGGCNLLLDEAIDLAVPPPCHHCGSDSRLIDATVSDDLALKEMMEMEARDPSLRSKDKLRVKLMSGDELRHSTGEWVKKERLIDRNSDRYFERVTNPTTGEVIHHSDEPLSEHRGHGSAKPLPPTVEGDTVGPS